MLTTSPILPTRVETHQPATPLPRTAPAGLQTSWLSAEQIPAFVASYASASGLRINLEDALASEIRGFFLQSRLVGGYRLGRSATRYAALAGASADLWPFGVDDAAEITHLWLSPEVPSAERRLVYSWILTDLLATAKPIVVGGSVQEHIARQQMRSMPHPLGEVPCPQLGEGEVVRFYYGTVNTVVADAIASGVPMPWLGGVR